MKGQRLAAGGLGILAVIALLAPLQAVAQDDALPKTIVWTAYNTGSAGYNQAVAIGSVLKTIYGCSAPGSLDTSLSHAAGLIEIAACHA